ncbi:cytochrome c3 family protein [Neobacillus drentensis]|uniref:cytochrome c3 family protein n=1 Tax=Neobacillus drentensis TaxID=220684 RepID=UPI000825A7A6|nr:cytochrome c3 family protein [Neobacillus drentensis]
MKRKNYKRKLISYFVIWSVVLSSLLFSSPDNIVVSASAVPEIQILTPNAGAEFNTPTVEIKGNISDDLTTADKLSVKVFEQVDAQQPVDITGEGILTIKPQNQYADFSFSKDFNEGVHTLTFVVTDEEGVSSKVERSFSIEASTVQADDNPATIDNGTTTDDSPASAGNGTTTDDTPASTITDTTTNPSQPTTEENGTTTGATDNTQPSDEIGKRPYMAKMYLIPKGTEDQYEPGKAAPSSFLPAEDMTRVLLDYKILIDIRSKEPLSESQPLITFFGDITGTEKLIKTTELSNGVKAYTFIFTPDKQLETGKTYYVYLNPKFSNERGIEIIPRFLKFTTVSENYGSYQFSADKGNVDRDNDYIHGPFSNVTNACAFCHSTHEGNSPTLEGGKYGSEGNNLCMACHDGTNGSPKIIDNDNNEHSKNANVSCSSCHNPHTPGTKENPNSMHSVSAPDSNGSHFKAYNKASSANGNADDFSLCLSCHNGKEDTTSHKIVSDIEKYYKDPTLINQSGHNIKATEDSGSELNGQLPCAECHETHGSENLNMLRTELGNINIKDDSKKFISTGKDWNVANERNFCLKCHNQSTKMYGKTAQFKEKDDTDQPIIGHRLLEDKDESCSSCHGGQSKSFIEAAHSPGKITK